MNKSFLSLVFIGVLLASCGSSTSSESSFNPIRSRVDSSKDSESHSSAETTSSLEENYSSISHPDSTSESSSTTSSSSSWRASSESTLSSVPADEVVDFGLKTISEVRELCKNVTELNSFGIGVNMKAKVTIHGLALAKYSLVKTSAKYGLDVSMPYKTFFGDETGFIACASPSTNDGNTLWGKVADYAGKETSTYEVTGYLSMYLGQPEIYVPGKTYSYDSSLNIKCDVSSFSKGDISFDQFYDKAKAIKYNCAGHGYGDVYTVKNVLCYENRNSVYTFTDGHKFMKVIKGNCTFIEGKTYDITGYVTTQNWSPAITALKATVVETVVSSPSSGDAIETTISDFKKIQASQDDTTARMDAYIDGFKNLYKASVYASYYTVNGKFYVTVSDNYYSSNLELTSRTTAQNTWGMVDIANDNYWNVSESQMWNYCPIGDYINEQEKFDIYFMPYQQEYLSKKPVWKIFVFNSLMAE